MDFLRQSVRRAVPNSFSSGSGKPLARRYSRVEFGRPVTARVLTVDNLRQFFMWFGQCLSWSTKLAAKQVGPECCSGFPADAAANCSHPLSPFRRECEPRVRIQIHTPPRGKRDRGSSLSCCAFVPAEVLSQKKSAV